MSKSKCKVCKKEFNPITSIYLDTNGYNFYCPSCFGKLIAKNPKFLNRILQIRYKKYC